jgi:alpha-ketoglutarate-dependent taurine dioxygenase
MLSESDMRFEPLSEHFGFLARPDRVTDLVETNWAEAYERLSSVRGGLLIYRGFAVDEQSFRRFTDRCGEGFVAHQLPREYVDGDNTYSNVAPGCGAIEFHTEMSLNPLRPQALWFYCVRPSNDGRGRIGFCDGAQVVKRLTKRTYQQFLMEGFKYELRDLPENVWRPVLEPLQLKGSSREYISRLVRRIGPKMGIENFTITSDNELSFDYRFPPIYRSPLTGVEVFACGLLNYAGFMLTGTGEPVPPRAIIEVNQATYQTAVWLDWQPGDVAIIDNTRVMHSREAFEDTHRRVLVRYSRSFRRPVADQERLAIMDVQSQPA